jgi:uncharacterized repeat protein (TIGR01451 family)
LNHFSRWLALGVVISVVISALIGWLMGELAIAPAVAQVTIPNQATVQYDLPGEGDPTRADRPSNTVRYPLSAVLGSSTLGLNLIKSADKSAAEPGDVVVYQLLLRNQGTQTANNLQINDALPLGVQFVEGSAAGEPSQPVQVSASGRNLTLSFPALPPGGVLNISYAAVLTPEAISGNGRNTAVASATGFENVEDSFQLTIRQGILSDCGTIIGRVFVDKNFDGEQQSGEPGVPNAVIFLESGNRIITDPDGLFSVANALSGNRVGALDLSSLPGYTLAPNLFRVEANSQSRLVRLEPGGLARMNFAVTPTFGEGEG